jgi:Uma2 family endonuclease
MSSLARKSDKKFTYEDYLNWADNERWEIIDGSAYNMSPAPSIKHQKISRNFTGEIYRRKNNLKNCSFFEAPTDVVFDEFNVVQPDIFIVCNKDTITEKNIQGVPDLIIEITSPSTEIKDKRDKLKLYEKFGVKEYIIVYPERDYLERYLLSNNKFLFPEIFNWDEIFKFKTFDIEINLWEIFEKNLPEEKL